MEKNFLIWQTELHSPRTNSSSSFQNKLRHIFFQTEECLRGCHCHHVWLRVLQKSQRHPLSVWRLDNKSQSDLHTLGCRTAGGLHLYLIQVVQQQGWYKLTQLIITMSPVVNQKSPRSHPSLQKKTRVRASVQKSPALEMSCSLRPSVLTSAGINFHASSWYRVLAVFWIQCEIDVDNTPLLASAKACSVCKQITERREGHSATFLRRQIRDWEH